MVNYSFRSEYSELNKQTRTGLPGQFIELEDGVVHYELCDSPSNRQTTILVHGFSVPYYIWDPTVAALSKAGIRILRYDLYGRGYTDRPSTVYDLNLFERQLFNLVHQLHIDLPVNLVGISMGGPIVAYFTVQHPEMVQRLCMIDPAGFSTVKSVALRLIKTPFIGEILLDILGEKVFVGGLANDFYQPHLFPEYQQKYLDQMKYRGFKHALLSTIRQEVTEDQTYIYQQLRSLEIPILVFWGKFDKTFPITTIDNVKSILPSAEIHIINEAGHVPHYEQPDKVNPILISFLQRRAYNR